MLNVDVFIKASGRANCFYNYPLVPAVPVLKYRDKRGKTSLKKIYKKNWYIPKKQYRNNFVN